MGQVSELCGAQKPDARPSVQAGADVWQIGERVAGQLVIFGITRREARLPFVPHGWQYSMMMGTVRLEFGNTAMAILH
jgi:hypothetical protein